jgi:ATP adenylyltransferase
VTGADRATTCVFCDDSESRESLTLARGRFSYVVLNLYPYNSGHLMVVPDRHIGTLAAATADELSEMMTFVRDAEVALTEAYAPQGINVGMNLGRPAGAGIADHVHVHLVPRWTGDTSFISVIGNVRVLPEALDATAARLRPIFQRILQERG